MIERAALVTYTNALLSPERFKDYCPNGLQVEGTAHIGRLVSGVTASLALIDHAIETRAHALLVHHGLFWRNQNGCITGWMKARLAALLAHDINVLAYHLPLDAHPLYGNNAQLAKRLGLEVQGSFGEQNLGLWGQMKPMDVTELHQAIASSTTKHERGAHSPVLSKINPALSLQGLLSRIEHQLNRPALLIEPTGFDLDAPVGVVAWCSGGAQSYFESAMQAGARVFLTGEISESQVHLARECGVAFVACGHHATERGGAQALGDHLAEHFSLEHEFVDIDNPA